MPGGGPNPGPCPGNVALENPGGAAGGAYWPVVAGGPGGGPPAGAPGAPVTPGPAAVRNPEEVEQAERRKEVKISNENVILFAKICEFSLSRGTMSVALLAILLERI